ncbi:hypothetical protein [Sporisorium scitamineum]|uniref:Uncharacterized protein n=1 Tax=Sporisorium scitamineum TaxID=49012 RepID=A0A0F7S324_9BASI|nr:hypothetical protein [Sporisorium scitamineum]
MTKKYNHTALIVGYEMQEVREPGKGHMRCWEALVSNRNLNCGRTSTTVWNLHQT